MPLIETKGAASAQGFGLTLGFSGPVTYIEDVFSTYLYTGNSSTQTITNNIDLSGKGGLVWSKARTSAGFHVLIDTNRGASSQLFSNTTSVAQTGTDLSSFSSTGYVLGAPNNANINTSGVTNVSWTFRKQSKFFDVVTYTGNGANRTISHNLGSVPGCIIVKRTDVSADWQVYHRSLANTEYLVLNSTDAKATGTTRWNSTTPTSTVFSLGTDTTVNASGGIYVAYLFAHNAGGFGLTGSDNVISCGSYNGSGAAGNPINLGYEPQWLLIKSTLYAENWYLFDSMRGMTVGTDGTARLYANTAAIETILGAASCVSPTATGFSFGSGSDGYNQIGETYIYIAIRRGPMKVPTSGTSVYTPQAVTKSGTVTVTAGFPVDLTIEASRTQSFADGLNSSAIDRLRGGDRVLITSGTASEYGGGNCSFASNTTFTDGWLNYNPNIYWMFRRAPGFFDVVCYTGTGTTQSVNHNLGVTPNLIIVKRRTSNGYEWVVQNSTTSYINLLFLNQDSGYQQDTTLLGIATSTTFEVRNNSGNTNSSGASYVAYLFASCPGVSKVGSYTSTGAAQTIDCGFTGGARFVLIKRTNNIGDWYVYDSARGISSGNDPYLFLNSTAAEVTGTNYVDTDSTGFKLGNNTPVNTNGGSYIYLAIA